MNDDPLWEYRRRYTPQWEQKIARRRRPGGRARNVLLLVAPLAAALLLIVVFVLVRDRWGEQAGWSFATGCLMLAVVTFVATIALPEKR